MRKHVKQVLDKTKSLLMSIWLFLQMELPKGTLSGEKVSFSKEKSILNDIAQETKDKPGYGNLTEEELMEKVETILLERIKNGDKKAYFQLGLFYYEQVLSCSHPVHCLYVLVWSKWVNHSLKCSAIVYLCNMNWLIVV